MTAGTRLVRRGLVWRVRETRAPLDGWGVGDALLGREDGRGAYDEWVPLNEIASRGWRRFDGSPVVLPVSGQLSLF